MPSVALNHVVLQLVGDGTTGSPLPTFLTNSTTYNVSIAFANQTISWDSMPSAIATQGWNGFALLVDDVEVYVGTALNYSLAALEAGLPHFFRLAVSNFNGPSALAKDYEFFCSMQWGVHLVILQWLRPFGRMELGWTRYPELRRYL